MKETDPANVSLRFPWRSLAKIAVIGLVCSGLVAAIGWLTTRVLLGRDETAARARIESDVRSSFDAMARSLRTMAISAANPTTVRAAIEGDVAAARELFTVASRTVAEGPGADVALTVYAGDGQPIAWAGRPSELPADRLQGKESWFIAQGALGLRLVYVMPVLRGASAPIGTIATESALSAIENDAASAGLQGVAEDRFRIATRFAPVSIELAFEGAQTRRDPTAFEVRAPSGDRLLTATVASQDLALTRQRWRRATTSLSLMALAAVVLLLAGPLLDWRNRTRNVRDNAIAVIAIAVIIVVARVLMRLASPADWSGLQIFSGAAYASPLARPLLNSPFDFLLTALVAGGLVALLFFAVERWRIHTRRQRVAPTTSASFGAYLMAQLIAGTACALVLSAHAALLRDTVAHATPDLLHFALPPWNPSAISLQVGLIVAHATALGLGVLCLRIGLVRWRVRLRSWRTFLLTLTCWVLPLITWRVVSGNTLDQQIPLLVALAVVAGLAFSASSLKARYRHGSQAFRLMLLTLGLVVPAFAFYPTVFQRAWQAKSTLVQTRYAPQALNQRQTVQTQVEQSLRQIDMFPDLGDLIAAEKGPPGSAATTDPAFQVWQSTSLASYPVTSSVELYGPDGTLVSRYAFNLPEDLTAPPRSQEEMCEWQLFEEVAPFFAEERRVLHAGRAICEKPTKRRVGSIVVHAILDYENLPFTSSRNPYVEILRPTDPLQDESASGRDVEYAVYGWSRTPLYSSGDTAWVLDDATFARIEQSRSPFWANLRRGDDLYDVYLLNDRGGIYALGFPDVSALGHLVNLAELTVLAVVTYVLLLGANAVFGSLSRRATSARALLREVRASFYRKLFLAFVAAVFLPVVLLAIVTRNFVVNEMGAGVEQEALRTAFAASRVVEDLVGPRAAQQGVSVDDNLMVWVSRLIDQDANVFTGPRLVATSERNLFASGLIPTRTNADVYDSLVLRREAATVTRERIGAFEYLVAGAPMTLRQVDAMLTVPLASRQREIEAQIDTLDRRVLLAALLFILGGAGLGYSMAERIADPVSRLTRATRRIARGDLDARIAATSSDEFRRLVEDFNRMAGELQRQRSELERTNRLEAWAEMARQVAHEIKNPLTPIQLNAEHLRRVHADRGEPLGQMVQECVATILKQVKLLRQIASEFSSFASSPTAKPTSVEVTELLHEIIDPYRAGLQERIRFDLNLPPTLPRVHADRTLIARSLTNIVENALHAMPGPGTLTVVARAEDHAVRIRVSDTGVGMDKEALARAFEPYFSTKSSGTGLGLPIAKRNVELSGGAITMASERDHGTTVEVTLPLAAEPT